MPKSHHKKKTALETSIVSNTFPEGMGSVKVETHCKYDEFVAVGILTPHPLNPNTHPAHQIELLAKIILAQGWRSPIVVSLRSGYIVAGHGRLMAAIEAGLTHVPVEYQDFESEESEWSHLVADNRIAELAEIDETALKQIMESLSASDTGIDMTGFDAEALKELLAEDAGSSPGYTRRVEQPHYECKSKTKPELSSLYDETKTLALVKEIEATKLSPDEKGFLIAAAQRHTVFNFENAAEYYAHSGKAVQSLMENSAMVIIDFKKAIELGYVKLTDGIREMVNEQYPDEA